MVGTMIDKDDKPSVKRRDFLRGVGVAAAGAAGAAVMTTAPAIAAPQADENPSGYRETDHIRRVYQTARF